MVGLHYLKTNTKKNMCFCGGLLQDTNEMSFPHINVTYSLSTNMSTVSVSQNLLFFRLFRSPSLTSTLLGFNYIFLLKLYFESFCLFVSYITFGIVIPKTQFQRSWILWA